DRTATADHLARKPIASPSRQPSPRMSHDHRPPRRTQPTHQRHVNSLGLYRTISPTEDVAMGYVLIRDAPDEVLTAIDARAAKLSISRVEYVRRRLAQD